MEPIDIATFCQSPQGQRILAYPSGQGIETRWAELQTHPVQGVYAFGPKQAQGINILGLGYCGLVLLVWGGQPAQILALKIRRTNAPQPTLRAEGNALQLANGVGVGPQLVSCTDNFLLMQYVDGPRLVDWLRQPPDQMRPTLRHLIEQAHRLDRLGLDHGALRCVTDHALVTPHGPVLIDFSGASQTRRPANITTLLQGLLISTQIAGLMAPHFAHVTRDGLIQHLRDYKQSPSQQTVDALYKYLGL
ncbi:MAG: serine/threonine protein kinase [Cyanobacteria bacterium P01_H01_bin.26]